MDNTLLKNLAMGEEIRPSLIALKEQCKDAAFAEKLKQDKNYKPELLAGLLQHEDAKVRKNAALLMGIIKEQDYPELLWKAYAREDILFVKSSYLKALQSYDCGAILGDLEKRLNELTSMDIAADEAKHYAEEISALRVLLPKKERKKHVYHEPSRPVRVVLTTMKELRGDLFRQVNAISSEEIREIPMGVVVKSARIERLAALRIYQEMLFPLNGMKSVEKNRLVNEILEGNLFPLLGILHEASEEPYTFRVQAKDLDVVKIARQLEAYSKGRLVNSVSDYEIELKLITKQDGTILSFLKLFTRKDNRFAYRKNVVATSMNPVKAAGMICKVKEFLKAGAQILDPYCGVGTLLMERDLAVNADVLYGTDIFGDAIIGARENTELASSQRATGRSDRVPPVYYVHRDFYDFTSDYLFDEIVTEMPKPAHEEADEIYKKFFTHSYDLMNQKGVLILDSAEKGLVHKYLRLMSDCYRLIREIPLSERTEEYVYVIERL